jgi:type IV pilus assembly protein PilB
MVDRSRPRLGELLVGAGVLDEGQLDAALAEQREGGGPLGTIFVRMGFVDEETLIRTLARQLKLPLAWLRGRRVGYEVLALVPGELAHKHRCLPLSVQGEGANRSLFLAMQDPVDLQAIDEIRARVDCAIKPVLVAPSELEDALRLHYPLVEVDSRPGAPRREPTPAPEGRGEPELLWFDREVQRSEAHTYNLLDLADRSGRFEAAGLLNAIAAIADALIEQGVFSRDELMERLAGRDGSWLG